MEIKKLKIGDNNIEFVCRSESTRNGFAHEVTMFVNNCERGSNRTHYLNRTWESYT